MTVLENSHLITRLNDYIDDIKDFQKTNFDVPSNLKIFEEKLIEIIDFIKLEGALQNIYEKRVKYFSDLIHRNEIFKNLTERLKKNYISFWENIRVINEKEVNYNLILNDMFDFNFCTELKSSKENIKSHKEFLAFIKNKEELWRFYAFCCQLEPDFSKNSFKGFRGVNYEAIPIRYRLFGYLEIPENNREFDANIKQFYELTKTIPIKQKVREFNYIAAYYNFLIGLTEGREQYKKIRYAESYYNIYGENGAYSEAFFIPKPREKKTDYLINILREIKYSLQNQSAEKGQENFQILINNLDCYIRKIGSISKKLPQTWEEVHEISEGKKSFEITSGALKNIINNQKIPLEKEIYKFIYGSPKLKSVFEQKLESEDDNFKIVEAHFITTSDDRSSLEFQEKNAWLTSSNVYNETGNPYYAIIPYIMNVLNDLKCSLENEILICNEKLALSPESKQATAKEWVKFSDIRTNLKTAETWNNSKKCNFKKDSQDYKALLLILDNSKNLTPTNRDDILKKIGFKPNKYNKKKNQTKYNRTENDQKNRKMAEITKKLREKLFLSKEQLVWKDNSLQLI